MRKTLSYFLLLFASVCVMPGVARAIDNEIIVDAPRHKILVQPATLTRRYGAVQTEAEVAAQELEAGVGQTNTFKFVRWYRPYYGGWYGYYGYGPRYYAAYRPRFYGYYGPGWGGYYGPAPYAAYYAPPPVFYGGYYGGYGGCYYW